MVEIFEIHEIIVKIDDKTSEKYLQRWYNDTGKLDEEEMQELLFTECEHKVEVIKVKFIDKDYLTNISTYKVKFYHKDE